MIQDNQRAFLVTSEAGTSNNLFSKSSASFQNYDEVTKNHPGLIIYGLLIKQKWSWVYDLLQMIQEVIMTTWLSASNSVCWWWSVIQNRMGTIALCDQNKNMCLLGRFLQSFTELLRLLVQWPHLPEGNQLRLLELYPSRFQTSGISNHM